MRVKLFSYLIVGAMLTCAASMFTSCKDNDGDLYAKFQDENLTLRNKLENDYKLLEGKLNDLNNLYIALKAQADACKANCDAARDQLRQELLAKLGNYYTKEQIDQIIANLLSSSDVDDIVESYLAGYFTQEEVNVMLNDYYKKTDLDAKLGDYLSVEDAVNVYLTKQEFQTYWQQFIELQSQVGTLAGTVQNIENLLNGAAGNYTTIAARFTAIESALSEAQTTLNEVKNTVSALQTAVTTAEGKISALEGKVAELEGLKDRVATAESDIAKLKSDLSALDSRVTALETELTAVKARVTAVEAAAQAAQAKADANETRLNLLDTRFNMLNAGVNHNAAEIAALKKDLAAYKAEAAANLQAAKEALEAEIDALELSLNNRVDEVQGAIDALEGKLTELAGKVAANASKIEEVDGKVDALTGRVDNLEDRIDNLENRISSLVLQQVTNPVMGSVSLPLDLQSMVLFNYYGESATNIQFPMFELEELGLNYGSDNLPGAAAAALVGNIKYVNLYEGQGIAQNEDVDYAGNMGKIYFTINPSNINLEGKTFSLVNSRDEECAVKLTNVRPSDKLLTFGYTRAANGFYEADATILPKDASSMRYQFSDGWKSTIKNALKNRNLKSLGSVGAMVLKQLNTDLPAYGLKAAWTETVAGVSTDHAVYTNYGIAATTLKPLSYSALYGQDFSSHVPSLPNIDNFLDRVKFDFDVPTISFGEKTIDIKTPELDVKLALGDITMAIELNNVKVHVPHYPVSAELVGSDVVFTYDEEFFVFADMTNVAAELNAKINEQLSSIFSDLSDDINEQVNDALEKAIKDMTGSIQKEVNDLLKDMEDDINSQLADVLKDLQNKVNGKIESITNKVSNFYDKVENLYGRVTNIFANPNHYLQGVLLYEGNGGKTFGRLSNSKAAPTRFAGEGTAVNLLPTSYTAELLAPAYKKYVAVTNVFDNNGNSAQAGDANCKRLVERANASKYMNEVIDGERKTVAFDFAAARGTNYKYTYEIFYQALDYAGHTTSQTFYVTVK